MRARAGKLGVGFAGDCGHFLLRGRATRKEEDDPDGRARGLSGGDARAACVRWASAGRRWQAGPGVTGRGERGAGPRGAGLGRSVGRAGRERGKWAWAVGFAGLGLSPVGFGFGLG